MHLQGAAYRFEPEHAVPVFNSDTVWKESEQEG